MKTFRELISWELEQEKNKPVRSFSEEEGASGKLSRCVLRKLKYLSANGAAPVKPGVRAKVG